MTTTEAKKPRAPPKPSEHPKFIEMITAAISALKDRKGSSRQAITKYIKEQYKVNHENFATYIKHSLKKNVANGILVQAKGTGASGSFKLGQNSQPKQIKKVAKPKAKKPAAKKPKKPAASAKKSPVKSKKKAIEKTKVKKKIQKSKSKPSPKKKVVKKPTKKPAKGTPKKKPAAKKTKVKK